MDTALNPQLPRTRAEAEAELIRRAKADGLFDLTAAEVWWRDRSQILEDHGYQLRPRLRPGWKPTWEGTDLDPIKCEDSIPGFIKKVVDAFRKDDGEYVAIMNLKKDTEERDILVFVDDAQRSSGKDYHFAPILDRFEDEREPELEFFVMPLLRMYDDPPFDAVSEIVHLFRQLLEALAFLHSLGVAHRDCSHGNILMDAPSVFPNGFHPCRASKDRSGIRSLTSIPRYKAKGPINYYLIDFDLSVKYEEGDCHVYVGEEGADQDVPELSATVMYDPFPVDVFILGNVFKKGYLTEYNNLTFLTPLVEAMTAKDPKQRPTAEEALKQYNSIISSQNFFIIRRLLIPQNTTRNFKSGLYEDIGILFSAAVTSVKLAAGIPARTVSAMRGFVVSKLPKKKKTA